MALRKTHRSKPKKKTIKKRSIPWRKVLQDHIEKYSEAGITLRGNRDKSGLSQKELGDLIGVSQNHLREMENGKRPIGKAIAKKCAAVFMIDCRNFL